MNSKQVYLLVDNTDWGEVYRVLLFHDDIMIDDIQNSITEITQRFCDEDFDDWCISDLLKELSKIYGCVDLGNPLYLEC